MMRKDISANLSEMVDFLRDSVVTATMRTLPRGI